MCDKCLLPVPLDSRNFVETLCDSWVLSTSVCGTKLRKIQKCQRTLDTNNNMEYLTIK